MPSYPTIFKHIDNYLLPEGYSCETKQKSLEVKVPVYPNTVFVGRVDGIVCVPGDDITGNSVLIAIEIKRDVINACQPQSVLEFCGMTIRSSYPVLHILTDMDTFQ